MLGCIPLSLNQLFALLISVFSLLQFGVVGPAQPILKFCATSNFKTARNCGCRSPIFQIKTGSVSEKIHLPFPALRYLEASLSY